MSIGFAVEAIALLAHRFTMLGNASEGVASYFEQQTSYAYPFWIRNSLVILVPIVLVLSTVTEQTSYTLWFLITLLTLSSLVISRALFYVLVIPTTMPGAFFWRNKGFVEHARESGLADMPQMGVAYERHHHFNVKELLDTIKETTLSEKVSQFKRIFTG